MRARNQGGQIVRKGPNWVLRIYEDRDGRRVRVPHILGRYTDYPLRGTDADLAFLRTKYAEKIGTLLAPVNKEHTIKTGTITLRDFVDQSYWPRCEKRAAIPAGNELHIEPTTIKSYRVMYDIHIKDSNIGQMKISDFTPGHGQRFIEALDQNLSHNTHMRIKNLLSGIFAWAIVEGAYRGANPMNEVKAGGRKKGKAMDLSGMSDSEKLRKMKIAASHEHAYTLEEVAEMMDKLPEPARTICTLAAFTGLSRSELRGLKWSDYDGESIKVQRKVVGKFIGAPKTNAREGAIHIIHPMRRMLAKYKKDFPPFGDGWIFRGIKGGPLNLDDVSRREIPQHINGAWFGWHAFRRGLGTRLNEANVDDKDIQLVLRHADVSTTMAYYVKPSQEAAKRGLKKLSDVMQKKYKITF
jgi:integrase